MKYQISLAPQKTWSVHWRQSGFILLVKYFIGMQTLENLSFYCSPHAKQSCYIYILTFFGIFKQLCTAILLFSLSLVGFSNQLKDYLEHYPDNHWKASGCSTNTVKRHYAHNYSSDVAYRCFLKNVCIRTTMHSQAKYCCNLLNS